MPLWAHHVTLYGLSSKPPFNQSGIRYNLADCFILVALISLATTLAISAPINRDNQNWILILSANLFAILMWYKCIQLMNQNGILGNARRIAMQTLVYPSSILSLSYLLYSGMTLITSLLAARDYKDSDQFEGYRLPLLIMFVATIIWIYLTRRGYLAILKPTQIEASAG